MINNDELTDILSKLEYIANQGFEDCLEKDQIIIKLRELVFWVTYYEERIGE